MIFGAVFNSMVKCGILVLVSVFTQWQRYRTDHVHQLSVCSMKFIKCYYMSITHDVDLRGIEGCKGQREERYYKEVFMCERSRRLQREKRSLHFFVVSHMTS